MDVDECGRCNSKIVTQPLQDDYRHLDIPQIIEPGKMDVATIQLCSICFDDLNDWAFGEKTVDRSNKADPIPLERMANYVERHIRDLDQVLTEIESEIDADK